MIRAFRPKDAAGVARMLAAADEGPITKEGVLHRVQSMPARAEGRWWVAEEDGISGWAEAKRRWSSDPEVGQFRVVVGRDARRRGIGSCLWDESVGYLSSLGVRKVSTWDDGTDEAARFVTSRGFTPGRQTIHSVLAPLPTDVTPTPGVRLLTLGAVRERVEELFHLYQRTESDMPSDEYLGYLSFEEWRYETLEHPHLDADGSVIAELGGTLAAFTFMLVVPERRRAENEMTGTLPEFRGRGLATLVKRASIDWAAANGMTEIWTSNHAENAAMLAVNRRLGYRPVKTTTDYARETAS